MRVVVIKKEDCENIWVGGFGELIQKPIGEGGETRTVIELESGEVLDSVLCRWMEEGYFTEKYVKGRRIIGVTKVRFFVEVKPTGETYEKVQELPASANDIDIGYACYEWMEELIEWRWDFENEKKKKDN